MKENQLQPQLSPCNDCKFRKYSRDIQHFLPEESHERRYYQIFRPFSPFSDAEALEDGEAARRLGLSADSAAVPLQNVP